MKQYIKRLNPLYLLVVFGLLCGHDLYIKMETYFLQPNQQATFSLYNGTFEKSENIITRDRMLDASFMVQGERVRITPDQWEDQDTTITQLTFDTGEAGTYVAGVSTKARNIELEADKFNNYLEHDGVLDMLEYRKSNNLLDQDAVESYQKHVKAIYQVGGVKTDDWKSVLGYPIEFVPLENPYKKHTGDQLEVKLLLDGVPLSNQLVYANHISTGESHTHGAHIHEHDGVKHTHEHSHDDGEHQHDHADKSKAMDEHSHTIGQQLQTNEQGIVKVDFPEDGIYYLRTIHMVGVADREELTHISKWATLTFEVTHKHGRHTHTHHDHDHKHKKEIPSWIFIVGSLFIIGLLFLVFRNRD
ncbi:MAG: DUF4198 domain-containing protein [Bacteroidota bacterium]